jgi:penicillin-binding protein 1A
VKFVFLVIPLIPIGIYWYQYRSIVQASSKRVMEWKKSHWQSHKDFNLLSKAIVAAEDPAFLSEPKLECGLLDLLKSLAVRNIEFNCSPIISHASQLATAEIYVRPSRRKFAELSMLNELSNQPNESLDIILNKTYLGLRKDGTPIEGFEQAAEFYFGGFLGELRLSQVALLAGMVQAPNRYAPGKEPAQAKARRDFVLDRMLTAAFISEKDATLARQEALQ